MNTGQIKKTLESEPVDVNQLADALPESPGFYAWWVRPGALPNLPEHPHPRGGWDLLYIGIAPVRATSGQAIRSRVVGNHIRGNTGASTFRLSLAALLFEDREWQPLRKKKKVVLSSADNSALRTWQEENLALTWAECPEPWTIEDSVISEMGPPMNLAGNSSHAFHATMTDARKRFRAAAR